MKSGMNPKEALDKMINADDGRDVRQLALLNAKGEVAAHTGDKEFTSYCNNNTSMLSIFNTINY